MTIIRRPFFSTQIRKARVSQDVIDGVSQVVSNPPFINAGGGGEDGTWSESSLSFTPYQIGANSRNQTFLMGDGTLGNTRRTDDGGQTFSVGPQFFNTGSLGGGPSAIVSNTRGQWLIGMEAGWMSSSEDDGINFTQEPLMLGVGSGNSTCNAIATDDDDIWVACFDSGYNAISFDNRATWQELPRYLLSENASYMEDILYLGGGRFLTAGNNGDSVTITTDGTLVGTTFTNNPRYLNTNAGSDPAGGRDVIVSLARNRDGVIIALVRGGWFARSLDNGYTWAELLPRYLSFPSTDSLVQVSCDSKDVFMAVNRDCYVIRTEDAGVAWADQERGLGTGATGTGYTITNNLNGIWMAGFSGNNLAISPDPE